MTKIAACFFLFPLLIPAQSSSRATLSGVISDPSERVVSGAAVRLTNQETQFARQTHSDDAGFYRFDLVPPGTYDLHVEFKGFAPSDITALPLQVGAEATENITLSLEG